MLNFGTFWNQFGQFMKENPFDKHFDTAVTLQELLDDDAIITEFRNNNTKLSDFIQYSQFKQLIDYVIVEPKDDSDPKRAFRYPFYSCELLCCDTAKVLDFFFPKEESEEEAEQKEEGEKKESVKTKPETSDTNEVPKTEESEEAPEECKQQQDSKQPGESKEADVTDETAQAVQEPEQRVDLLNYFLSFVTHHEGNFNLVLAGYFSKVFVNLFQRRQEDLINKLFQNDTFMSQMAKLVFSRSMAEVLSKLIICDKDLNLNDEEGYLPQKQVILTDLLAQVRNHGQENFEIGANLQNIVQEMCQRAYTFAHGQELIQFLLSTIQFTQLVELTTHQSANVSIAASTIVLSLLQLSLNDELKSQDSDDNDSLHLDSTQALEVLVQNYPNIFSYLKTDRQSLGQTSLKLVEILQVVLRTKHEAPKLKLAEHNIFSILNPLVRKHPFNNLYHLQYHKIVTSIIEQEIQPLVENIFVANDLIGFLSNLTENVKPTNKAVFRKGYLGFVAKLGKFLEDYSEKHPEIQQYLVGDSWASFKTQFFTKAQRDNEKDLGGLTNNRDRGSSEVDFDFSRQEIQNRYAPFLSSDNSPSQQQSEHQATSNIFEGFQAPSQQVQEQPQQFGDFASFGWQPIPQTATNGFGWDSKHQQEEASEYGLTSSQYWKAQLDNDLERRAFLEFEASLD